MQIFLLAVSAGGLLAAGAVALAGIIPAIRRSLKERREQLAAQDWASEWLGGTKATQKKK